MPPAEPIADGRCTSCVGDLQPRDETAPSVNATVPGCGLLASLPGSIVRKR